MSEQPATYRPSAEVDVAYQAALSATMDRCTCQGEGHDGTPCFRWIPRGAGRCVPCAEGYGAHGYNGGVGQAPSPAKARPWTLDGQLLHDAEQERDALRAIVDQALPVVLHGEMISVCPGCNVWEMAERLGFVVPADRTHVGQEARQHEECSHNLGRLEQERADALGKLTALHTRCETLATERDTLRATVMALHTAVARAQQERDALREKALTELEGWSLRRDALVSEREQLRAERDALQTRLDQAATIRASAWERVEDLTQQNAALEGLLLRVDGARCECHHPLSDHDEQGRCCDGCDGCDGFRLDRSCIHADDAPDLTGREWTIREINAQDEADELLAERGAATALAHLRHLIRECAALRVPWADVVAAAGEEA